MIVVIEMMFTLDPQNAIKAELERGQRILVSYWPLKNGEAFVAASRTATWEGEDFRMPGSHHEKRDLVISRCDPDATGRPVRLTMFTQPKDGDALVGRRQLSARVRRSPERKYWTGARRSLLKRGFWANDWPTIAVNQTRTFVIERDRKERKLVGPGGLEPPTRPL